MFYRLIRYIQDNFLYRFYQINNKDRDKISNDVFEYLKKEIIEFLDKNNNETFSSFAIESNLYEQCIIFCFNTNQYFEKTLNKYKQWEYWDEYNDEKSIFELKYNTWDWKYQVVDKKFSFNEKFINKLYRGLPVYNENNYKAFNVMYNVTLNWLIKFTNSEVFNKIPKDNDFKILFVDHDEYIYDSIIRMNDDINKIDNNEIIKKYILKS